MQDNVLIGLCEVYLLGQREGEKNKNINAIILVEVCATSHEMFVCVCMLRSPSKQLLMFLLRFIQVSQTTPYKNVLRIFFVIQL